MMLYSMYIQHYSRLCVYVTIVWESESKSERLSFSISFYLQAFQAVQSFSTISRLLVLRWHLLSHSLDYVHIPFKLTQISEMK